MGYDGSVAVCRPILPNSDLVAVLQQQPGASSVEIAELLSEHFNIGHPQDRILRRRLGAMVAVERNILKSYSMFATSRSRRQFGNRGRGADATRPVLPFESARGGARVWHPGQCQLRCTEICCD